MNLLNLALTCLILLALLKLFCDSLVEIVVVNKERKQIKIHFLDYSEQFVEGRGLMTVKGITYPSFVWKRCFFPKEDI